MEIADAIELIKRLQIEQGSPQLWADLGAGSGLFSRAIATLLPPLSKILCIDKVSPGWKTANNNNVELEFIKADFSKYKFEDGMLDGIIMANSLHFVKNKAALLDNLSIALKPNGHLVIVEYDSAVANAWVPYPIPFEELKSLFSNKLTKIGERRSKFGPMIYCCEVKV